MTYQIVLAPVAFEMLAQVRDRRVQGVLKDRIDGLAREPEKQGKPLLWELAGYRSLHAVGQRYRIVYRVERDRVRVLVIAVGLRRDGSRRDVYELARKLIRLGLVEPRRR